MKEPQTAASRYPLAPSNGLVPTTLVDAHSVPSAALSSCSSECTTPAAGCSPIPRGPYGLPAATARQVQTY